MASVPFTRQRESLATSFTTRALHLTTSWVTRQDELAAEDPAFYCDSCFKMLHYSEDGSKLCNFRAYPYFDHIEQPHVTSSS